MFKMHYFRKNFQNRQALIAFRPAPLTFNIGDLKFRDLA